MSLSAISAASPHSVAASQTAAAKAPSAPPPQAKLDSDGDHDGSTGRGSAGSSGRLNIKA